MLIILNRRPQTLHSVRKRNLDCDVNLISSLKVNHYVKMTLK